MATEYATRPPNITGMPPGVPYIIGNEGAERFSFYGMRAILVGFMTQFLVNHSGALEGMPQNEAQGWFHQFVSSVYWMPFFGAILADGWWASTGPSFISRWFTALAISPSPPW